MNVVETFIILDDVQFSKQSWQHRNRIRTDKGLEWLTVPVVTKGKSGQLIRDTKVASNLNYVRKHLGSISTHYSNAPGFAKYYSGFADAIERSSSSGLISELNVGLIDWLREEFELVETRVITSSYLKVEGGRSERLVNICESVGAKCYISPPGSVGYLEQDAAIFDEAGIEVRVFEYEHPVYSQSYDPFIPYASSIDLLLNEGTRAKSILESGLRGTSGLDEFLLASGSARSES